jgi:hypothetical protein
LASDKTIGCLTANADLASTLNADEASYYTRPGRRFAKHETVLHSAEEYVRGETHTNTVEGYYSIFKRGMKGVYQHCREKPSPLPCRIRFQVFEPYFTRV